MSIISAIRLLFPREKDFISETNNWLIRPVSMTHSRINIYEDMIMIENGSPVIKDPCFSFPKMRLTITNICCSEPIIGSQEFIVNFSIFHNGKWKVRDISKIISARNDYLYIANPDCLYAEDGRKLCFIDPFQERIISLRTTYVDLIELFQLMVVINGTTITGSFEDYELLRPTNFAEFCSTPGCEELSYGYYYQLGNSRGNSFTDKIKFSDPLDLSVTEFFNFFKTNSLPAIEEFLDLSCDWYIPALDRVDDIFWYKIFYVPKFESYLYPTYSDGLPEIKLYQCECPPNKFWDEQCQTCLSPIPQCTNRIGCTDGFVPDDECLDIPLAPVGTPFVPEIFFPGTSDLKPCIGCGEGPSIPGQLPIPGNECVKCGPSGPIMLPPGTPLGPNDGNPTDTFPEGPLGNPCIDKDLLIFTDGSSICVDDSFEFPYDPIGDCPPGYVYNYFSGECESEQDCSVCASATIVVSQPWPTSCTNGAWSCYNYPDFSRKILKWPKGTKVISRKDPLPPNSSGCERNNYYILAEIPIDYRPGGPCSSPYNYSSLPIFEGKYINIYSRGGNGGCQPEVVSTTVDCGCSKRERGTYVLTMSLLSCDNTEDYKANNPFLYIHTFEGCEEDEIELITLDNECPCYVNELGNDCIILPPRLYQNGINIATLNIGNNVVQNWKKKFIPYKGCKENYPNECNDS